MKFIWRLSVLISLLLFACNCGHGGKINKDTAEQQSYQLKIAYNVLFDSETDNYEVFCMDLDGKNVRNLTGLEGVEWTYYANEDDIYFVSDRDTSYRNYQLYKMKADGSLLTKISELRLKDSWHSARKNGAELIINPHSTVDSAFYIIDSSQTILKKIRPNLAYFSDPSFSPDGKHIAFRGAHFASKREQGFVDEIYLIDADGSNLRQLTNYPKTDTTAAWYAYKAGPPKWHPSSNFISYSSFQKGKYSLYGITADGKKQWKLTTNTAGEVYHDWSPDGKWLVTDLSSPDASQYHIGLINWDTKAMTILTDTVYAYQQAPVFVKVLNNE